MSESEDNNQTDSQFNKENKQKNEKEKNELKCQTDEEVTKKNKCANNDDFIEFDNVKVFCRLSYDSLDLNREDDNLLTILFDNNGNLIIDQLNNLEFILDRLNDTNDLDRCSLAEKLFNLIQSNCLINNQKLLDYLIPLIIQLIHPSNKDYIEDNQNEQFLQTRKYAIDSFDEILKQTNRQEEKKVNELLNQLRYFCSDLHKLKLNQQNDELIDISIIDHPIDAICSLMKISFDEYFRNLICKLGGIESIAELLVTENQYHGFLLKNYDQIKNMKCDNQNNNLSNHKIDQKWVNTNCITLRRYTRFRVSSKSFITLDSNHFMIMCLTNLTFADKQSKLQLSLNIEFLNSLLAQLNYLFCEELIQVTSSVLRNLSWKASKTCKTILSELNSAALLMSCSMQIKKETTLKCILYSLWNISSHNIQNKQQICEVDGSIKFLISLLEYRSSNNTLTIVENITGVIKNISSFIIKFENLRKILRINNCHEILLKHLKSTSLTIVCNCVGILWNLSKDNLLDQKILINLGAISFLKNLTLSKHKIIAIASKEALKNLLTSECLKNNQLDLESISFKAFSMDRLNCTNLLSNRKRMLQLRELKNSLKETQSINNELLGIKNNNNNNNNNNKINYSQTTLIDLNNQTSDYQLNTINDNLNNEPIDTNNIQLNLNTMSSHQFINHQSNEINLIHRRTEILDVTHSASDYFDLYKDNNDNLSSLNDNLTINNLLQSLTTLKEQNLDIILNNDFYLNTNMVTSCNFPTCYLSSSTKEDDELIKRSSIYSTISEPPIMYYDNDNQFAFTEKDLNDLTSEELLEEEFRKLSFKNDFRFYNSSNVFHAYPVIIQESNECLREDEEVNLFDDDLYKEKNEQKNLNEKVDKKKIKMKLNDKTSANNSTTNSMIISKIPVPVQQTVKSQKIKSTDQSKQNKTRKKNYINNVKEIIKPQNNLSSSFNNNSLSSNNSTVSNNTAKSSNNSKSTNYASSSNDLPSKQLMQQQKTKKENLYTDNKVKTSLKSKLPQTTKLTKSKTMEKNLNTFTSNLTKSRTTENLCNRTYDLTNEDLDEINNDNTEANDLTYNIDIDKRNNNNVTYILPSSESSDRTLKNETEPDERTLVWQPDNEDEKTDKQVEEINTYVQNFNSPNNDDNLEDDDDATLHLNEVNLEIDSTSIENLNLIDTQIGLDGTEIADSFSFIENTKPPLSYGEINYSITSSLNNSLLNSGDNQLSIKNNASTESSTTSATKLSRLRSPKAKVFDLSSSPPTNTFTITKSTKLNKSKDQSNQALSTSGYQTSLNSSLLSNNSFAVDKINPPSILNQISGISSLNNSAYDCISTCDSISSINSDINLDLSTANNSLNSSLNGSPFKNKPIKTSTPKHQFNKSSCSKIAKPVTHLSNGLNCVKTNIQSSINHSTSSTVSKTDTFRKNKTGVKKLNTSSSNCSSIISSTSSSTKSDYSTKIKSIPLKVNNQDNLKKKTITNSKSLSRISTISTEQKKKTTQSKISSISSNLWKKTVSNQQNISSKVFKKKSSLSLDKKERSLLDSNNQQNTNSLIRSSTFEKLPTSNEEAIKISSSTTNKNKIRPIELQNGKRSIYH